jgi:hypothetical protein
MKWFMYNSCFFTDEIILYRFFSALTQETQRGHEIIVYLLQIDE